jgi:hypothetical protein
MTGCRILSGIGSTTTNSLQRSGVRCATHASGVTVQISWDCAAIDRRAPESATVRGLGIAGTDLAGVQATVEFGVERLGVCELVFENDDAAGSFQGGASVDEFAGSGCHP